MLKCVIFDLGNTLTNDSVVKSRVYQNFIKFLFKKHNIQLSLDEFKQIKNDVEKTFGKVRQSFGVHRKRYLWFTYFGERTGIKITKKEAVSLLKEYNKINVSLLELNEGAIETLEFAKKGGLKTVLVTNGWPDFVEPVLDKFGLRKYFDMVIMTRRFGERKSTLEPFKIVLKRMKIKPEECLMIGDNAEEDGSAIELGINFCLFDPGRHATGGLKISNMAELKNIIHF